MGMTSWIEIGSLQQMMVAGGGTPENCLKAGVHWILENLFLATELLIIGTVFHNRVSCTTLNNFKSHMHLHQAGKQTVM